MPRSAGTYTLPRDPVVSGAVIEADWANETMADIATALTNSIAKDGTTAPTADLNMAGFKHTSVAKASARNQYATVEQIQDAEIWTIGSIIGTNTITGSVTPAITAFATGMRFQFVPAADNTGAVTIAVNGLAAKDITKNGTAALEPGDLVSGNPATIVYDGTRFVLQNPITGAVSTGSFTPTISASSPGNLSVSYSAQAGQYWMHNNLCFFQLSVAFTPTHTTASGSIRIAGLPFAHSASPASASLAQLVITGNASWPTGSTQLSIFIAQGNTFATIIGLGDSLSSSLAAEIVDFPSGGAYSIFIHGFYPV